MWWQLASYWSVARNTGLWLAETDSLEATEWRLRMRSEAASDQYQWQWAVSSEHQPHLAVIHKWVTTLHTDHHLNNQDGLRWVQNQCSGSDVTPILAASEISDNPSVMRWVVPGTVATVVRQGCPVPAERGFLNTEGLVQMMEEKLIHWELNVLTIIVLGSFVSIGIGHSSSFPSLTLFSPSSTLLQ